MFTLRLTRQSDYDDTVMWEPVIKSNYGPQMRGANKLTGKMELVLQRDEWMSLSDDNLDSADSIFFNNFISLTLLQTPRLNLFFYLTHEHVAHSNEPTCQFT